MARSRASVNRADRNQLELVTTLRSIPGFSVLVLSQVGNGAPDLLIGYGGHNVLVEVKVEGEDLRANQREWWDNWRGGQPIVATDADDVLAYFGAVV